MPENVAVEISSLSKTFKNIKALDNISVKIYRHEIYGLLGPNGSGKTTLLRILCTLMPPDRPSSGSPNNQVCRVNGFDLIQDQPAIREKIGYVPQHDSLYLDLSAMDNLILFSTPYCPDKQEQRERIKELLDQVKLYERRHDLVKTFSGGMKKRLSIACSLVHRPEIIFLDEITVGLDTSLRREIWNLIIGLKKTSTIVVTTHYIPEAEQYCDRVALMLNGHVLDYGTPEDLILKNRPANSLEEVMLIYEHKSGLTTNID